MRGPSRNPRASVERQLLRGFCNPREANLNMLFWKPAAGASATHNLGAFRQVGLSSRAASPPCCPSGPKLEPSWPQRAVLAVESAPGGAHESPEAQNLENCVSFEVWVEKIPNDLTQGAKKMWQKNGKIEFPTWLGIIAFPPNKFFSIFLIP